MLLSAEENCAHHIDPPNELELNHAFTRKMNHLLCVMKALQRFRGLLAKTRARKQAGASSPDPSNTVVESDFDPAEERAKAAEIEALIEQRQKVLGQRKGEGSSDSSARGPDYDVSEQEPLFLGIGTGSRDDFAMDEATPNIVADSPTAVDFNVYDRAYENAVQQRLKSNPAGKPTLYLTKFVKDTEQLANLGDLIDKAGLPAAAATGGVGGVLADLTAKVGLTSPSEKSDKADPITGLSL